MKDNVLSSSQYEVVIGLEVHVQLKTRTKLFSACEFHYADSPNSNLSEFCLALPGTLPIISGVAVDLAVRAALVTHCEVHRYSVFSRKHYFYPDLPKGYQISQYEQPLATKGYVEFSDKNGSRQRKRIRLNRIHLEEDAGKLTHVAPSVDNVTLVDLNRSGVPLIEIVSEPDIRSPLEAKAYLRSLQQLLRYAEISDANMELGQFRCDANVSLRKSDQDELGTRTEIKNLNSFRAVENALRIEVDRQRGIIAKGNSIQQATLGYDADRESVWIMRSKENAADYRYFSDPDLVPLMLSKDKINKIRTELPELPEDKCERFRNQYELSDYDALLLTSSRSVADFFERATAVHGSAKTVANWVLRDVLAIMKEKTFSIESLPITPENFAKLIMMAEEGRVTVSNARSLLPALMTSGKNPEDLVLEGGFTPFSDLNSLAVLVENVIADNANVVSKFKDGDARSLNYLIGEVMRVTEGRADPNLVRASLLSKIED